MFEGDPLSIETHLNNDWSLLLRNLKVKEDSLFELLQYNHKIINQARDENTELFVNDQILQHQKQLAKVGSIVQGIESEEKEIHEKYEGLFIQEERAMKLMGRVGARILEIYHSSFDKCKGYDQNLNQKYVKIKKLVIQLANQSDGIYLDEIIKGVSKYSKQKLDNQIERLKRLITALMNGEYTKLKEIYAPKERKTVRSVERKIDVLRNLSKAKAEKEAAKAEQKHQQKVKKQKQKLMNSLYSTMELSKQQFHDEEGISPQAKLQRLFNQILARNRYNSEQIIEFHTKKDLYEEKIRAFKEYMEKQSKKITEVFIRRPIKKDKPIQLNPQETEKHSITMESQHAIANHEPQSNIQNIMTQGNIDVGKNQRKSMNSQQFKLKSLSAKKEINDLPAILNSFLVTNQNFSNYRFDNSNRQIYTRTGRNILPDIGKGTSLDQKTQITKIKIDKILRTTIKNDDKNHEGSQRKHQSVRKTAIIHRQQAKMIEESHRIKTNLRNIDLSVQGTFKRVLAQKEKMRAENANEDNCLYVKKAELKYYQPKLNLIF